MPLPLLVVALAPVHAQSVATETRFEIASVRRNESGTSRGTARLPESGQVSITNATVRMLIGLAYEVERFALVATNSPLLGEGPTDGPKFDVQAKPPDDMPPGRQRLMLQKLLEDRFHLRVHRETRPTPVYVLKMVHDGRFGPQLARTEDSCAVWQAALAGEPERPQPHHRNGTPLCFGGLPQQPGVTLLRDAGSTSEMKNRLQAFVDRPLFDETGLAGNFEWTLSFALNAPDATNPSLFTAIEEQLGLKLETRTAPYEVLVVDSIDWPTAD